MDSIRDAAKNEHTMDIRSGLPILKSLYGQHMDEYDYLDIAVDALRDIKHFGSTEYLAILTVGNDGEIKLPCNLDTIDAVTTSEMGLKAYSTRVRYEMEDNTGTDIYFRYYNIFESLGHNWWNPGIGGLSGEGYISYQLKGKSLIVDRPPGSAIAIAFTGISMDMEGFPFITRKQANAIAAIAAQAIAIKNAMAGDKNAANTLEFIQNRAGRLKQAASIPEDISDNELDEVLNAKTTFNRKSYRRPTKYSR